MLLVLINTKNKQHVLFFHEKLFCLSTLDKTSLVTILFRYIIHDVMYLQMMQYQFLHSVMVLACILYGSLTHRDAGKQTFEVELKSTSCLTFRSVEVESRSVCRVVDGDVIAHSQCLLAPPLSAIIQK